MAVADMIDARGKCGTSPTCCQNRIACPQGLDWSLTLRSLNKCASRETLVGITHHENIVVHRGEVFQQDVLCDVSVLKLIHQHVMKTPRILLAHVGMLLEQLRGVEQQVVKVNRVGLKQ